MNTNIEFAQTLFTKCCKHGCRTGALTIAVLLLAACHSRSGSASAQTDGADPQESVEMSRWLQIVPAPTPQFDPAVHDYVIDCNSTASIDLTAAAARLHGFLYLGTTNLRQTLWPESPDPQASFRQTVRLQPGQRLSFYLMSSGAYSVRCLPPDFPKLSVSISGVPAAEWYVFSPGISDGTEQNYLIITDSHGTPVWWYRDTGQYIVDAKVLDSGHIAWAWLNSPSSYSIRSFSGQLTNTLSANLDFHDLQPTGHGTWYAIRYVTRTCPPDCADMSAWGGGAAMAVTDAEIVEIDANSNILWTWRTRDHIDLSETGATDWFPGVGTDIIHMNAVETDGPDGILFSARHLNAVYRILRSTGAIDWKLGGTIRPESLTVLGDTRPTAIGPDAQVLNGQHDVRRWADGTISVHDNGTKVGRPPAVMRYQLDLTNRTAQVVQEIDDARVTASSCCGSARLLAGGHWLVQWGATPFVTELDSSGQPVMTITYNDGPGFSYRAVPVATGLVRALSLRNGMDAIYGDQ